MDPQNREKNVSKGQGDPQKPSYQHPLCCYGGGEGARCHRQRRASVKAAESTRTSPFADKRPPANDGELESTSAAASPRGGELKD